MTTANPESTQSLAIQSQIKSLEQVLAVLLGEYRALLACIEQKSDAIRHARMDRISEIFQQETALVRRISESERSRIELITSISRTLGPHSRELLRVTEIAKAQKDVRARDRLLEVADQLRETVTEVKDRSSAVRSAAEALSRHMSGVMQLVRSALSRAGVYEQRGQLAIGAQLDFNVDVKT